jgi:hypothetical protein
VCIYSLVLQGLIFIPWFYFVVFTGEIGENPQGKSIFASARASVADLRMRIATKTSGKIGNFGGIIFAIVHLFRLGSNGFW